MKQSSTYELPKCHICGNTGFYRDYQGVYHPCPKCNRCYEVNNDGHAL